MGENIKETKAANESEALTKARNIKNELITVISKLYKDNNIDQIMPLLDLLKLLDYRIVTNSFEDAEMALHRDNTCFNGENNVDVQSKIRNLVHMIHIESSILFAINNGLAFSIRIKDKASHFKKIHYERLTTSERKKLFIIILKHILHEKIFSYDVKLQRDMSKDNSSLESDLMNLIKVNCDICSKVLGYSKNNAIDQFCTCKVDKTEREKFLRVSGVLEISLLGFMGHYNYQDLNNIFNGSSLPCSQRGSVVANCECLGIPKTQNFNSSQFKRKIVITIDNILQCSSDWSKSKVKGLVCEKISISRSKEIGIQVWETHKDKGKKETVNHLIATTTLPLQLLTKFMTTETLIINMEPAGIINFEVKYSPPSELGTTACFTKHKIRRNPSILKGRKQPKVSQVCISIYSKVFKDNISKISARCYNRNVPHDDALCTNGNKKKYSLYRTVRRLIIKSLCIHTNKLVITSESPKKEAIKTVTNKFIVATNSTLHCSSVLNKTHQRFHVPFIYDDKNALFECQKEKVSPQFIPILLDNSLLPCETKETESLNVKFGTPIASSRGSPRNFSASTPKSISSKSISSLNKSNISQNINICEETYWMSQRSVTRSNLELSALKDVDSKEERCFSDDEDAKKYIQLDEVCDDDAAVIKMMRSMMSDDMDMYPLPCTPEMKKISIFKVDSDSRSINITQDKSLLLSSINSQNVFPSSDNSEVEDLYNPSLSLLSVDKDITPNFKTSIEENREEISEEYTKLEYDHFELLSVLGQGNFGKVLLGKYEDESRGGGLCAIKVISKKKTTDENAYETVMSERSILMIITPDGNPFLVGLIGCFQTDSYLIFAVEYACGGDLMGHIHQGAFGEDDARFYCACVLLALDFLHSKNIMYRDIKLENILMDVKGYVKLTDFGLSKMNMNWNSTTNTFCGTPEFLAPEIVNNRRYTRAVDWWAFGVLLYEMILGEVPFEGETDSQIFHNINDGYISSRRFTVEALSIIKRLLQKDPTRRLGYGEDGTQKVMSHIFFKKTNWTAMRARTITPPHLPQLARENDTHYFEPEFTNMDLTIKHDDEPVNVDIIDELFKDFDTCVKWDNFVNFTSEDK